MRLLTVSLAALSVAAIPVAAQAFQQISEKATAERRAKGERLICRYMDETGSLSRRRRQCFTRTEWDRIAEAARARGQRLTTDGVGPITSN